MLTPLVRVPHCPALVAILVRGLRAARMRHSRPGFGPLAGGLFDPEMTAAILAVA